MDLDVSDGNPQEYNFITLFYELVGRQIDDPKVRLSHLIRYTKGDGCKVYDTELW